MIGDKPSTTTSFTQHQIAAGGRDKEEDRVMTNTYIVQPGDTLSGIAKKFGVSLESLIKANPQIKNPDLIHPGEAIKIP